MKLIYKCKNDLIELNELKNIKDRKKFVSNLKNCDIYAISEIASNCLLGNIPLNNCQYKNLEKYKNILRKVSSKNTALKSKKNIVIQKGGFLNILLPPVLSLLTKYIINRISKK